MRIYISGKITDTFDYLERFSEAESMLSSLGFDTLNPAKVCDNLPKTFSHDEYLKVCIAMLECCDTIFMLDGWEESKGARKELLFAENNGKSVIFEADLREDNG